MPVFKSVNDAKKQLEQMRAELRDLDKAIRDDSGDRKTRKAHAKLRKEVTTLASQLRNL